MNGLHQSFESDGCHEKVIMVIAGAFVIDPEERILLQQRSDTGEWGLPGDSWK
ncbi:hypothetical protein [Planococcus shixiaomingii]|uniref:hypothetical protein n=1 Tax=Planococcus shixiaomingii TaxID=3058393 RepID=UPI003462AEDA